jgi:eukaryotic-like serine/threonine-protein kinase
VVSTLLEKTSRFIGETDDLGIRGADDLGRALLPAAGERIVARWGRPVAKAKLSPELLSSFQKHPLPSRKDHDRFMRGDLAHGAALLVTLGAEGDPGRFSQWLSLASETGEDVETAIRSWAATAQGAFTRWCFAEGKVDLGVLGFHHWVASSGGQVPDADIDELFRQVESVSGSRGVIEMADRLLVGPLRERALRAAVSALTTIGDHEGAQRRLAQYGDASATMAAGALKAEDVQRLLAVPSPAVLDDATTVTRAPPEASADGAENTSAAPPAAPLSHPLLGRQLAGRFVLSSFLSEGRIAQVFEARSATAPMVVAVKVLLPGFTTNAEVKSRFLRAAEKSRRLHHDAIAAMHAAGEEQGLLFVVMELIRGENLQSYVDARGALPEFDALSIVLQIGSALESALGSGVVHRSLRPSNVFVTRLPESPHIERVKVTDFGTADVVSSQRPLDGFVAPERARGELGDPRADVYSMGALLFMMLTGRAPFAEVDTGRLARAVESNPFTFPAHVALSPSVVALVQKATQKDPAERFENARAFGVELRRVLEDLDSSTETKQRGAAPSESSTATSLSSIVWGDAASRERAHHPLLGTVLASRFEITGLMRAGGMAQLFSGVDLQSRARVAVKIMHPSLAAEPELVKRFAREARLAAQLRHENIVKLVHVGDDSELLFIVMELLGGEDLSVRLKQRGRMPETQAAAIAVDVSNALAYAHSLGVVHRDIKPANVMLCSGERGDVVKLLDFGIAKVLDRSDSTELSIAKSAITVAGDVVGTPRYMSPEQGRAAPVDHRTDLYALGVVLYELVTGQVPFDGETALQIVARHVRDSPVPPGRLVADLHPGLEALILRLLEKDPMRRPQSSDEVRAALLALMPQLAASMASSTSRWLAPSPPTPLMRPSLPSTVDVVEPPRIRAVPKTLSSEVLPGNAPNPASPGVEARWPASPNHGAFSDGEARPVPARSDAAVPDEPPRRPGISTERMERAAMLAEALVHVPPPRAPAHERPSPRGESPAALLDGAVPATSRAATDLMSFERSALVGSAFDGPQRRAAPGSPPPAAADGAGLSAWRDESSRSAAPKADHTTQALQAQVAKLHRMVQGLVVVVLAAVVALVALALSR